MPSAEDTETYVIRSTDTDTVFHTFRLVVTKGPDTGQAAANVGLELTVGADIANQLVLTDPAASRHHFALRQTASGVKLTDLGSTNGTTVNGLRAEAVFLKPGAVIGAGMSLLQFEVTGREVRESLSSERTYGRVLGGSIAMRRIFSILERVAAGEATVLLEGETGTGKSLLAEAIHRAGPRAKRPFVVLDCGAIPPSLIESELFGHEKGSFTGAVGTRLGAFESARTGTLFLDEVGELPLDMQPKLLRALEDRVIKRVGGNAAISLDMRLIAATNRNLRAEVNHGRFRSDLFYRLNTVPLRIPPLRERPEDIVPLVEHFYAQFAPGAGPAPSALLAAMVGREWTGNVRELRSAVEHAVLLGDLQLWSDAERGVGDERAAQELDFSVTFRAARERANSNWERRYLSELMRLSQFNVAKAARTVRMDRNHLTELLRRHRIRESDEGT